MQDDVLMTNPESSESQPEFTTLPLLALRDVVVYPQMQIVYLWVVRLQSKQSSLRK